MNFLLDTNVVSEWTKPSPNIGVVKWLAEADEDRMFLSVITFGELQYGMARLQAGAKRKRLEDVGPPGVISFLPTEYSVRRTRINGSR